MKKALAVLVIALLATAMAVAEEPNVNRWDSHFKAGDTTLSLGVGFGGGGGIFSIAAYPGFEQTITDFKIGDVMPLSIGAAAKGLVGIYLGSASGIELGAGVFVPFHFGLKGLGLEFLDNLDFYVAPGIALSFDTGNLGWTNPVRFGFGEYAGVNYFIDDSTAIFVEQVYWGYNGATIGLAVKM